jgi:hypothetical protein
VAGGVNPTRERIIEQARPLLEPDESVAHVVRALEGPSRWLALFLALVVGLGLTILVQLPLVGLPVFVLVFTSMYARRIILATDQALVVLAGKRFRFVPTRVLARLDVETKIGPFKGLWLRTTLAGRKLYIVPRTAAEARAADADIDAAD